MKGNDNAVSPVIGVMLMIVVTVIIAAVVSAVAGDLGSGEKTGPKATLSWQLKYSATGAPVPSDPVTLTVTYTKGDGTTYTNDLKVAAQNGGSPGIGLNKDGLVFTHQGGDPIDLKDLQMNVAGSDLNIILDYSNIKGGSGGWGGAKYVPALGMTDLSAPYGTITDISASGSWSNYTAAEIQKLIPNKYFYKLGPDGLDMADTIIRPGESFIWLVDNNNYGTLSGSYASPGRIATYWAIKTINSAGGSESMGIERGSDQRWVLSHKPSDETLAKGTFEYPDT